MCKANMYTIVVYAPVENAPAVREALAKSGAGVVGLYDSCSFTSVGEGCFRPLAGADPTIGRVGELTVVPEARIEAAVRTEVLRDVVKAVRAAHCYEEPGIHIYQIMDYSMLLGDDDRRSSASASSSAVTGGACSTGAAAAASVLAAPHAGASLAARKPMCIVLEGLDGVGKTTAATTLAERLGAKFLRTPPDCMRSFRPYFDRADDASRKAFYEVGNFMAGEEAAATLAKGQSVVIDRYYASTFSYRYGRKVEAPLPPAGDAAYAWPAELHKPDHMILITLPEADRLARRASRSAVAESGEEVVLRLNPEVPGRINEAYRRFGCTEVCITVDDSVDAVVRKIMAALGLAA